MAEQTIEQKRALAMASARLRLQESEAPPAATLANVSADRSSAAMVAPNVIDQFILDKFGDKLAKAPDIQAATVNVPNPTGAGTIPISPGRIIQGAADLPMGVTQMIGRMVGAPDKVKDIRARTEQLRGEDAGSFDWQRLGGAMLNPLPYKAAGMLPTATTLGARTAQGAAMGAGIGATTPVTDGKDEDFWKNKSIQSIVSALVGGAIPGAADLTGKVVGIGRNLIDPLLPGGTGRAAARLSNEVAGDRRGAVIQALEQAKTGTQGSPLTAGQAASPAGSAEFSSLQKIVAEADPSRYAANAAAQRTARGEQIGRIAGTEADVGMAKGVRSLMSETLYKDAESAGIDKPMADAIRPQINNLLERPSMQSAINKAKEIFGEESITLAKDGSVKGLQMMKQAVDDLIEKAGSPTSSIGKNQLRALQQSRSDLISVINDVAPKMREADKAFGQWSKPIDRMKVGQALEEKLMNPSGNETPGVFLRSLDDAARTIKQAGVSRYKTIDQALEPHEASAARGVASDLERDLQFKSLASAGMPAARKQIGVTLPEVPPTGFFSPIVSATRGFLNRATGKATDKVIMELAKNMENPAEMARIMKSVPTAQLKAVIDAIAQQGGRTAAMGTAELY